MVNAIDKKLLRDLAHLKGQVITIALVVACGISSYVTMQSAYESLLHSRDQYYADYRFGDVFASLKRAPLTLRHKLEALDGVASVQTRTLQQVLVPMPHMTRPASGVVQSRSQRERDADLNAVHVTRGRDLDPSNPDEILVLDSFAGAHGLQPGDKVAAVLNGTLRSLSIAGIALSPEYVMAIAPGQLAYDPSLAPVFWMNESAVWAAFQMEGAFNSVSLRLQPGIAGGSVLRDVENILRPFGGFGAVSREKQTSNYILTGELVQLNSMASFVPYLFLFVAALLVNIVLSRLVQLQRPEIATLKAVGYSNRSIGVHYLKLVSLVVLLGAVSGVALGAWLGREMTLMYTGRWFHFPSPHYRLSVSTVLFALGVSSATALIGAWLAARSVMDLPPAEAMKPPAPARFRRSIFELLPLWRWLDPATRMIWRELSRRPLRLLLSSLGISLAVAILIVGRSMWDAIDHLMNVHVHRAMREDLTVTFIKPLSPRAVRELQHLPGVLRAEGLRAVPARFRVGHRFRDSVVTGYPDGLFLRKVLHADSTVYGALPDRGVVLTKKLGEILGVTVGDTITLEFREGEWRSLNVAVAGFVDEPFGLMGHMRGAELSRLLGDDGALNSGLLHIDPARTAEVLRRLKDLPQIAAISSPRDFKRQFDEQSAAIIGVFTLIMTLFAAIIAVGVVYNNARVALSQRGRELASLRVLGYTRREISTILFGEQAVQVALAIPLGIPLGRWLSHIMMSTSDPETYRFPIVISGATYSFAITVTLGSAILSALIIRRRIDTLDLIAVLKTRE